MSTAGAGQQEGAPVELAVHRLAGAIYGTILATTVVVTIGNHPENLDRALVLVAGTSVVFWMAHVYARGLAARVVARRALRWQELWDLARAEWPMLQSSLADPARPGAGAPGCGRPVPLDRHGHGRGHRCVVHVRVRDRPSGAAQLAAHGGQRAGSRLVRPGRPGAEGDVH
ncbi:hypothetical protein [Cellulomonas soli]